MLLFSNIEEAGAVGEGEGGAEGGGVVVVTVVLVVVLPYCSIWRCHIVSLESVGACGVRTALTFGSLLHVVLSCGDI